MVIKQNKWKDVVERWEDESTQRNLTYLIDSINRDYKHEAYVEQIFSIITAFASTIYNNAYSYDNVTRALYSKYTSQMGHVESSESKEREKQRKLLTDILNTMPKGFKDYTIHGNTFFLVSDDIPLTVSKANQFLDYLQSQKFRHIITKIAISEF